MIKSVVFFLFLLLCFSCKPAMITDKDFDKNTSKSTRKTYTYDTELSKSDRDYFARKLKVKKEDITNEKLYIFVKSWEETTYLYGGDNKNGVDCSALMQHLFKFVYNVYLPRTSAEMGFDSQIRLFKSMDDLKEGDLVFFRINDEKIISHVGIYLKNNMFFSAVSSQGCSIANIRKPYWKNSFVSGGRLKN